MIQANDTVNSTTAGAQARSQESLAGSNARAGMASPPSKETLERLAARLKELVGEDVELPGQEVRLFTHYRIEWLIYLYFVTTRLLS